MNNNKIYFGNQRKRELSVLNGKTILTYKVQRSLRNQNVIPKKKVKKSTVTRKPPHKHFTLFSEIFKLKRSTLILATALLIVFSSFIPLALNIRSYFWEKRRVLFGERDALYNQFLIEGIESDFRGNRIETGGITTGQDSFVIPSLKLKSYTVKKGDSLFSIARKFNISIDGIITANDLTNAYYLRIGTVLKIPNMSGIFYTVKKGDNLSSITKRYRADINKLADVNDLENSTIHIGQVLFVPGGALSNWERAEAIGSLFKRPARGRLTSKMGFRIDPFSGKIAYHAGIDLANRVGTSVYASQFGRVTFAGYKGNFGKTIVIVHPQGYSTLYAHLDKVLVKRGQRVRQGERIGLMGNTGRSTGPHLHFEIHQNKKLLDPLKTLRM